MSPIPIMTLSNTAVSTSRQAAAIARDAQDGIRSRRRADSAITTAAATKPAHSSR